MNSNEPILTKKDIINNMFKIYGIVDMSGRYYTYKDVLEYLEKYHKEWLSDIADIVNDKRFTM